MASLVNRLADVVTNVFVAGVVDWLANVAAHFFVAGVIDRLAHIVSACLVMSFVNRLAHRVTLVTIAGFIDISRAAHGNCFCALIVNRLCAGVLLLFPNHFANGLVLRSTSTCVGEIARACTGCGWTV